MSKFQIHNTDDFVILESDSQAISVICFSITKIEDGVLSQLSRRIFNFFDSFGYSYVIQMSKSSLKLILVISAENVGEVINKVSTLLDKMQIIEPLSPYLIISTTNHMRFAEDLMEAYFAPLKKTSESRIIKIANKYWVFSSLVLPKEANGEVIQYFQDLLSFGNCKINLSSKTTKKQKKNLDSLRNILISYKGSTFEESIEFLNKLQQLSILYKERISFTLRFHSLNEIKRNKVLFLLGLTNKQQTSTDWDAYFKIERFIPNIQTISKRKARKEALPSHKEINQTIVTPKNKIIQILQLVKFPSFIRKRKPGQYEGNRLFSLFGKKQAKDSTYKIKIENINVESKPAKPLVSYGKEVSEDEMKKLVKNIPTPPS
ncbi:MAG: hypothetical protein GOP50_08840 [Candidatus Heimdallarchaeota archaeon]|nr:hypothetical protein [Candidatus Heimdallarchaeota archaeon]